MTGKKYLNALDTFCIFPKKPIEILANFAASGGYHLSPEQIINALTTDYRKAVDEETAYISEYKIAFKSNLNCDNLPAIQIILRKTSAMNESAQDMFLYWVSIPPAGPQCISPERALDEQVFLGSWANFLTELAEVAMPERWDSDAYDRKYSRLQMYIRYTFFRVLQEDKIEVSADGTFAAFNTGLVNKRYEDIYFCMVANEPDKATKWRFIGLSTGTSGYLADRIAKELDKLPQLAKYIRSGSDLYLPSDIQIKPNYGHILLDNLDRFPLEFLQCYLSRNAKAKPILDQIKTTTDTDALPALFDTLRDILKQDTIIWSRMRNELSLSLDLTLQKLSRNYRLAVPIYYPQRGTMSLLLPLYLSDYNKPSLALVVCKDDTNRYCGYTVLTLEQAYSTARLIGNVDSSWLSGIQ